MKYVLDTSALISGEDFLDGEFFTTFSAVKEARKKGITPQLQSILTIRITSKEPSKDHVEEVAVHARKTGDIERLSPTDIEILALAKELGAVVLSDDYSIQNLAKEMGIPYHGILIKEIEEKIYWTYRCRGCGKFFEEPQKTCPVCGSKLRTTKKKD
ncbi:MAG: nucleic acid-binding protein [Thermoplasmata archaeon]|nr:nucleic acid-binding protein [Thermoplasmata archaeon]